MIDIRDDDIQQVAGISGSPLGLWEVAETDEDYGMFIIGERKKENNILALGVFPSGRRTVADLVWNAFVDKQISREGLVLVGEPGPHYH